MPLTVETHADAAAAARALAAAGPGAVLLGGGTLVMRAVNAGSQSVTRLIRTTDPQLARITTDRDTLVIGAQVTMAQLMAAREAALLAPVARDVGGPALRSMATVAGNLFARAPYGDLATALLALDAEVALAAGGAPQPLDAFLGQRDRHPVVVAVRVPRPRDGGAFRWRKVARVHPRGAAVLSIAAMLPAEGGRLSRVRIAIGGMAPRPLRAVAVERALEGRRLDPDGIADALRVAGEGLAPGSDSLASEWYRRQVLPVHLRRVLLGGEGRR